jgi:hypothetical protein
MYLLNNIKRLIGTFNPIQLALFRQVLLTKINLTQTELDRLDSLITSMKARTKPEEFSNGSDLRWHCLKNEDRDYFSTLFHRLCSEVDCKPEEFEFFVMYNETLYTPDGTGSGNGWHFDSTFHQRKFIFYLSDVGRENGPFEYVPSTYSLPFIRSLLIKNIFTKDILRYQEIGELENDVKQILGNKGSGYFISTSLLHRGAPVDKGFRKALTFYMFKRNKVSANFKRYI